MRKAGADPPGCDSFTAFRQSQRSSTARRRGRVRSRNARVRRISPAGAQRSAGSTTRPPSTSASAGSIAVAVPHSPEVLGLALVPHAVCGCVCMHCGLVRGPRIHLSMGARGRAMSRSWEYVRDRHAIPGMRCAAGAAYSARATWCQLCRGDRAMDKPDKPRVVIADAQALVAEAFEKLLTPECEILGRASTDGR